MASPTPFRGRNKYSAKRTVVDGITFASKHEARRYSDLRLRVRAGQIRNLVLQVKYPITINGIKVCTYVADFGYEERVESEPCPDCEGRGCVECVGQNAAPPSEAWVPVVEDAKGYRTPMFNLKAKLMLAVHGIRIREHTRRSR